MGLLYGIPPPRPPAYNETILVPFSPESELSGIRRSKRPGEHLYYRRILSLPQSFIKDRVLLHFGAVDCLCTVYLNGWKAGSHQGGYWPFTLDITELVRPGENILDVEAEDEATRTLDRARGKQSDTPGGIWYTAQSGIWQTVWLESVPAVYITGLTITPCPDEEELLLTIHTNGDAPCTVELEGMEFSAAPESPVHLPLSHIRLWSPEDPYLYEFAVRAGADRIESYFALRSFSLEKDEKGTPRLCLNHKPLFF